MKKLIALMLSMMMVLGLFAGCGAEDTPSVYYLNFKPESDAAWQELAAAYTAETGVPVTVLTAASGTYEETLMAELAKTESEDTGSKANGGLYENVPKGYMVEPFENWIFDESRQVGDHGLVKTQYGYHVMYFVERSGAVDEWLFTESRAKEMFDLYGL